MNLAIIIGNLAKKPEVKRVKDTYVVKLVIATSSGEYPTEYHTINHWTHHVDKYDKYEVGDLISVDGQLQTRSYEVEGNKRWVTEIKANHVRKLTKTPKEDW